LEDFLNKFRGKRSSSISSFEFDKNDILREQVVKEILDIYSASEIPVNYIDQKQQESKRNSPIVEDIETVEDIEDK
jgi:hypothetical protein